MSSASLSDIDEWEPMRHIVKGNICYAPVSSAHAEDIGDVEDE